jgi:hypothetical protein
MSATADLELRRARMAQNQSLFREVNERIEQLVQAPPLPPAEFICECATRECAECVSMTVEEYEHVRSESNHFFVLPGHELAEVEETIERHNGYLVVAKLGAGAAVSARLDPRNRIRGGQADA